MDLDLEMFDPDLELEDFSYQELVELKTELELRIKAIEIAIKKGATT